jgi:hypothetical protein
LIKITSDGDEIVGVSADIGTENDFYDFLLAETRYSNLCALCEHPDICNYPDYYSGYDGALRCLSEHGGDVAWTKVYYVKKHFGVCVQHS